MKRRQGCSTLLLAVQSVRRSTMHQCEESWSTLVLCTNCVVSGCLVKQTNLSQEGCHVFCLCCLTHLRLSKPFQYDGHLSCSQLPLKRKDRCDSFVCVVTLSKMLDLRDVEVFVSSQEMMLRRDPSESNMFNPNASNWSYFPKVNMLVHAILIE